MYETSVPVGTFNVFINYIVLKKVCQLNLIDASAESVVSDYCRKIFHFKFIYTFG